MTVEIEPNAFSGCNNLFEVNIGTRVKKIGNGAFADCDNLLNVYFFGNYPEIAEQSFENVSITAFYPYNDRTWTLDRLKGYGGNITWVPWNPTTREIKKRDLGICSIEVKKGAYVYTGKQNVPSVVVKDGGYTLQKGKDYISYLFQ